MTMHEMKVTIEGESPLMVKSDRTVDPFDPYTIRMKEITDKKKGDKTDEDLRALRRIEWEAGLYYDKKLGPVIPGWNIIRSIRDGGARSKKGKAVLTGVMMTEINVPITYSGPRDLDGMYAAGYLDVRRIKNNNGGATIRARPRWNEWSLTFTLDYDDEVISDRGLIDAIKAAGKFAGIGEYRPGSPKGGQYGRYRLTKIDGKALDA